MRPDCPKDEHGFHDFQFVRKFRSDGKTQLRKQCTRCTKISPESFKFSSVKDIKAVPESIDDVSWNYYREQTEAAASKRKEERADEYTMYLRTDKWKQKRALVFARDNHLCQACLSVRAKEVHHLTYTRLFNEPLFDLVSVCRKCHEAIHNYKPEGINFYQHEITHTDWYLKHCKK